MKNILLLLLFSAAFLLGCSEQNKLNTDQAVNPIIGDISYVTTFGTAPTQATAENERIKTHLAYVEDMLRQRDVSHLPASLQQQRAKLLGLLHEYREAERFPKNFAYAEQRKPCFIDKEGNICAVGYLLEQTAGLAAAQKINSLYKYAEILEMDSPLLEKWVSASGLTLQEFAMIQPSYGYYPPQQYPSPNHIPTGYGVSSSLLGGTNLAVNTLNTIQLSRGANNRMIPAIGMLTGASQLALGILNLDGDRLDNGIVGSPINGANEGKKALSFVNIGLGTSTILLSGYNLITHKERSLNRRTNWNLFSFTHERSLSGIGLSLTRQF